MVLNKLKLLLLFVIWSNGALAAPLCVQLVSNGAHLEKKISQALNHNQPAAFQFNSSVEVIGSLRSIKQDASGVVSFVAWSGPTELRESGRVISGQDSDHHAGGFSSPIGRVRQGARFASLSEARSVRDLARFGLALNRPGHLIYESGIRVNGILKGAVFSKKGNLHILIFEDATARLQDEILYDPSWGTFDVLIAEALTDII